jgi:hypothetical protein
MYLVRVGTAGAASLLRTGKRVVNVDLRREVASDQDRSGPVCHTGLTGRPATVTL